MIGHSALQSDIRPLTGQSQLRLSVSEVKTEPQECKNTIHMHEYDELMTFSPCLAIKHPQFIRLIH